MTLDEANVRLIYSNTITNGEALEALANPVRPIITHVHELGYWIRHRMDPANLAHNIRLSARFVAASHAVKDNLVRDLGIASEKIDVVHEFVTTRSKGRPIHPTGSVTRWGIPSEAFVVGAGGTTDWRKAPDVFGTTCRAFRRIRPGQTVHFIWVGGDRDGPVFGALWHYVVRTGVADRVHFVGRQQNPQGHFAAVDVFAMVSREDPFPLVALEAASLGKPIVCFDLAGGTPELVEQDAGLVVPYLDLEAMASAILNLADNPQLRAGLGRRAAEKVRSRYDVQVVAPQILGVIQRVLDPAVTEPARTPEGDGAQEVCRTEQCSSISVLACPCDRVLPAAVPPDPGERRLVGKGVYGVGQCSRCQTAV